MPRDITHIILADEAAEKVKSPEIFKHPEAFHMGCVAEDAFLYTASPGLSTRLHGGVGDDIRAVVLEMMDLQKKETNPVRAAEQKAFIYGYLCHMAADLTIHPLIYSISGSQLKENNRSKNEATLAKACHRYAETWLDVYMMKDKKLSFNNFRPFRKIVANLPMRVRLDDFFTDCYQNALKAKKYTWGDNLDLQAQFHNGMTRQFLVDKVTQNQTIGGILRKLDRVLHGKLQLYTAGFYDFDRDIPQRLTENNFIHPVTGEVIQKSIKDLEQESVNYSVKFIQAADEYFKSGDKEAFLRKVPNINLDTGIVDSKLKAIRKRVTQEDFTSIRGKKSVISKSLEKLNASIDARNNRKHSSSMLTLLVRRMHKNQQE